MSKYTERQRVYVFEWLRTLFVCAEVFTMLFWLFCMNYQRAEPQTHGQLDMAWNMDGKCDKHPAHTDDIYMVMSFNARKVCFIKVPFCIVEWISTESGYFFSTLSAIPWCYISTALQKIKTPLLNLLQARRFFAIHLSIVFLFLLWNLLTNH